MNSLSNRAPDKGQLSRPPPFSVQLLGTDDVDQANASHPSDEHLLSLLPASYRTASDDLVPPSLNDIDTCVKKELNLQRLSRVLVWLWVAGRPTPPRPLHYQRFLQREIFITEQMDMHLVWTTGRIFLKPLPRFLLEPRFWTRFLSCRSDCSCHEAELDAGGDVQYCQFQGLWRSALGFLFSYAALISHESDFWIAREMHLLPPEVKWSTWRTFILQLDPEHIYQKIDKRFMYGELRLSRLNKIYHLTQPPFLRGYFRHWNQYKTFLEDNFAWLASVTIYIAIVLTAMQVGLATESLANNQTFQSASYGFTIFSILGPLLTAGSILLLFCFFFIYNWIATLNYRRQRFLTVTEAAQKWKRRGR